MVSPSLCWNPPLDDALVGRLTAIWVDATNAGGALGFLAPVTESEIAPAMARVVARVHDRVDDLLVLTVGGEPVGWVLLERDARSFSAHWRTVKRLQVHPSHQGRGLGRLLLEEVHRFARDELRLEFLVLTVRGGTGTDDLYKKHGYREVGRIPSAMRVGPGDDRDEILMVSGLSEAADPAINAPREVTCMTDAVEPRAEAPSLFGAPPSTDELLPWSWAVERLATSRNYWLTTVRAGGRPNARPVWGTWSEHGFSFSTGGRAGANVAINPACTVHLEDGWECLIVEGHAQVVTDTTAREQFCAAYNSKYDWSLHLTPAGVGDEDGADGPMLLVRPEVAYGWLGNLSQATRWRWGLPANRR